MISKKEFMQKIKLTNEIAISFITWSNFLNNSFSYFNCFFNRFNLFFENCFTNVRYFFCDIKIDDAKTFNISFDFSKFDDFLNITLFFLIEKNDSFFKFSIKSYEFTTFFIFLSSILLTKTFFDDFSRALTTFKNDFVNVTIVKNNLMFRANCFVTRFNLIFLICFFFYLIFSTFYFFEVESITSSTFFFN